MSVGKWLMLVIALLLRVGALTRSLASLACACGSFRLAFGEYANGHLILIGPLWSVVAMACPAFKKDFDPAQYDKDAMDHAHSHHGRYPCQLSLP